MTSKLPASQIRRTASPVTRWLDRRWYPQHGDHWDDELFRRSILDALSADDRVLDLGAGAGVVPQMDFRRRARLVCGVDPDPRVVENAYLDEARIGAGEAIPYPPAGFDLVIADNVLEHLDDPPAVFREIARVLRPGGRFLAKTPNRRHYVPALARLTPQRFHDWIARLRGRDAADTFPTRYRANTPGTIRRLAAESGLAVREIKLVEGRPEYLRTVWPLYPLGWLYERIVNAGGWLSAFRVVMIVDLERPVSQALRKAA